MDDRDAIRHRVRKIRLALDDAQCRQHSIALASNVTRHPLFRRSRYLGGYFAVKGEIDPWPIIESAHSMGKVVYMPVLAPGNGNRLWFTRWQPGDRLVRNRFGIPEPERGTRHRISPLALDLVLAPLVAFDQRGNRIGMGGGYYDRSFAHLRRRKAWKKPRLMGLAYEFQREDTLECQPWDIPLFAIATEERMYIARR